MDQTIARVAEQLGFQAARIWPQVVLVTWLTSLFWTIVDPILIIGSIVGIALMLRAVVRNLGEQNKAYSAVVAAASPGGPYVSRFDYDSTYWLVGGCTICIALAMVAALAITSFPDQLAGALYPEATTVLRIARGLR